MSLSSIHELDGFRTHHAVQFYERDEYLCERAAAFLAEGVEAGNSAVVIATEAHRRGIADELAVLGVDAAAVTFADARATLELFLIEGNIDRRRFHATIGQLLDNCGDGHPHAYGEMVDLLWREGNSNAATRLEELWNEVCAVRPLSLLCAYPMRNFESSMDTAAFDRVCELHASVVPTEDYVEVNEAAQLREIARLQQRAAALEAMQEEQAFLLEATTTLNRTLDARERVRELAHLLVPRIAAGCAVEIHREDGSTERVTAGSFGSTHRLSVPLKAHERVIGAIVLAEPRCTSGLLSALATHAGSALENARLYRMACDANRMKDEFLATLSHELRTPLTAILGWAKMLSLGIDPAMVHTALETIEHSALAQAALVDDLLDLSRIVTGKLTLHRELVDLGKVAENAAQTVRLAAEARDIVVQIAPLDERLMVMGDPTRLQQIVWNLLSNAVKFSHDGAAVSLALERENDSVRIVVRDQGRGIAPEFLPHVFEPFRQADGATTRSHSGLGLGLAIVKYLAEHHGGTVEAQSEGKNRGATFIVTLPLVMRRSLQPAEIQDVRSVDLKGLAILLVDDDSATRDLVSVILRRCGAEVLVADSVESACALLESASPHIVVTDIAMPLRDGYDLLGHLRARPGTKIPAIALTASTDGREQLHAAGFAAHVRKPIDPLDFARVVAELRGG